MTQNVSGGVAKRKKTKKNTAFRQTVHQLKKNKTAMAGLIIFTAIVIVCVFAPLFAPYGPNDLDLFAINKGPTWKHPFGTDALGRDCLSRLIYGGRYSLAMGFAGSIVGIVGGTIGGCVSGYFGKMTDTVIMRLCDIISAIPGQLLSIIISCVLGSNFINTVLALSIGGIPVQSRLLRANVLSARQSEYIEAAQSYNSSSFRIMFRHLMPNTIAPLLVNFTI